MEELVPTARMQDLVGAAIERDLGLICEGIEMVASGAALRVVVTGLRVGDAVLPPASRLASSSGVRIEPYWSLDDSFVAVAIEPLGR